MTTELAQADPYNQFVELMTRADKEKPKAADVAALRAHLRAHPELFDRAGNMIEQVARRVMEAQKGTPGALAYARENFYAVKDAAGWEAAPPLERLLIDAVALTWMQYHMAQTRYSLAAFVDGKGATIEFWEKRVNAAHRRYLAALETLARVRRLAASTPAVFNLNTAHQMIVNG